MAVCPSRSWVEALSSSPHSGKEEAYEIEYDSTYREYRVTSSIPMYAVEEESLKAHLIGIGIESNNKQLARKVKEDQQALLRKLSDDALDSLGKLVVEELDRRS